MAKRNVPARRSEVSPAPIVLPDGQAALFQDPAGLLELSDQELGLLATDVAKAAKGLLGQVRRAVGTMAWVYWHRLDEAQYRQWLVDYAAVAGVESDRTIERWRDRLVKGENLAVPAVAQQRRQERSAVQAAKETAGQAKGHDKMSGNRSQIQVADAPLPPPKPQRATGVNQPELVPPATASEVQSKITTPEMLDARGFVGRVTTTPADLLAISCTPDALRQARQRLNDALRIQEERVLAATRSSCDHSGPVKKLGYGVFCGRCGEKIR